MATASRNFSESPKQVKLPSLLFCPPHPCLFQCRHLPSSPFLSHCPVMLSSKLSLGCKKGRSLPSGDYRDRGALGLLLSVITGGFSKWQGSSRDHTRRGLWGAAARSVRLVKVAEWSLHPPPPPHFPSLAWELQLHEEWIKVLGRGGNSVISGSFLSPLPGTPTLSVSPGSRSRYWKEDQVH